MSKRTVLVTGGSGFIGSEVIHQLSLRGYRTINLDICRPKILRPGAHYVQHDLRKAIRFEQLPGQPDACIHLAAHIGNVVYGNTHPARMLADNALIDIQALQASAAARISRFIYVSSSLVYEQSSSFPFTEDCSERIPTPKLAYSFEKVFGERLCQAFHKEFGLPYTICRLFNAYGLTSDGQEDIHRHAIADLLEKVLSGQYLVEILGRGEQKRNYSHVRDLARSLLCVLENSRSENETFNLGNAREYSIKEIVRLIWKLAGQTRPLKIRQLPALSEDIARNRPSLKKARQVLGWKTEINMKEGLAELIAFKRKGAEN